MGVIVGRGYGRMWRAGVCAGGHSRLIQDVHLPVIHLGPREHLGFAAFELDEGAIVEESAAKGDVGERHCLGGEVAGDDVVGEGVGEKGGVGG